MYVYVILGSDEDYGDREGGMQLFKTAFPLSRGDVVKAPLSFGRAPGLVVSSLKTGVPEQLAEDGKIRSIMGLRESKPILCETVETWLCSLIAALRAGVISMDDVAELMDIVMSKCQIEFDYERKGYINFNPSINERSKHVFTEILADAIRRYEAATEEERKPVIVAEDCTGLSDQQLSFWKTLKDCESLILHGRPFFGREASESSGVKENPVEMTDEYLRIELDLERLIVEEIGKQRYMGYCHLYWAKKAAILKEMYGIEWKSPAQLNPEVMFD